MLALLLAWTRDLGWLEAAIASLAANVVVFALALLLGGVVTRLYRADPVAEAPLPISRHEIVLAASCVVLNSVVMWTGWALFRARWLEVVGDAPVWRCFTDAALLVVVMDLAMYLTHRIAHVPLFYRHVHAVHHRYDRPRPLTLFVLHPVEVLGFGSLWIIVLCLHGFSLGGMLLYLTLNTTFGLLGHAGVEPFPRRWVEWPVARWIGTSTFHARHHQRGQSNYGFYTALWDRLFGTLDGAYRTTFGQVRSSDEPMYGEPPGMDDENLTPSSHPISRI